VARTGSAVSANKVTAICRSLFVAGAAADEGRRHRARQQDRTDGLGHDGQRRALQGTRRARGVIEIAPDNRRDVKVGRAMQRVHQDDLAGYLQEQGGFEVLNLPAIAQRNETYSTSISN
jgi:hypothetical protein